NFRIERRAGAEAAAGGLRAPAASVRAMAVESREAPLDGLAAALPDGVLVTDRDVVAGYRHDWARDPDAGWPVAVVRATSTADVQAAVRWAAEHRVPLVPRGAGSGLSGGSSAVDGG